MDYGLIGEHLSHSFSKELHNKIGNYDYILKEIKKYELERFMTEKNFKGINVTIPYKVAVMPFLQKIDENASLIGAVNTVVNNKGFLTGYNTDFDGMSALIKRAKISLRDKKVLIAGTGGTSKTACAVARKLGAKSVLKLSREEKEGAVTYDRAYESHKDADVIINTTPCGMYPESDLSPIDLRHFENLSGVIDVIYNPIRTRLVTDAQSRNIKAAGGLYMLVHQAVVSAEKFFDKRLPEGTAEKIYGGLLHEKQNIVVIGMPGCGKSTVGEILAQKLGRKFFDTDKSVLIKYGKSPEEIIKTEGIESFRKAEKNVIRELRNENNCVISTGGGAVLNEENIINLKLNGKLYFLDRDIKNIAPSNDRPLSDSPEKLYGLYGERYEIYKKSCDRRIENNKTAAVAADEILADFERTNL